MQSLEAELRIVLERERKLLEQTDTLERELRDARDARDYFARKLRDARALAVRLYRTWNGADGCHGIDANDEAAVLSFEASS